MSRTFMVRSNSKFYCSNEVTVPLKEGSTHVPLFCHSHNIIIVSKFSSCLRSRGNFFKESRNLCFQRFGTEKSRDPRKRQNSMGNKIGLEYATGSKTTSRTHPWNQGYHSIRGINIILSKCEASELNIAQKGT